MARRRLTGDEEQALIAAAERERDDPETELKRIPGGAGPDATAVLSVRLPMSELRALRQIAVQRNCSMSTLLQSAVASMLAQPAPQYSYLIDKVVLSWSGADLAGGNFVYSVGDNAPIYRDVPKADSDTESLNVSAIA